MTANPTDKLTEIHHLTEKSRGAKKTDIASSRKLGERYDRVPAFSLASSCILSLADEVEALRKVVYEIHSLSAQPPPTMPSYDRALLIQALEEIADR